MFGRKKPRKNQRKGKKNKREYKVFGRILMSFKLILAVAAVAAMTIFFILIQNAIKTRWWLAYSKSAVFACANLI